MMGTTINTRVRTLQLPAAILSGILALTSATAGLAQQQGFREEKRFPAADLRDLDRKRNEMVRGGPLDQKVAQDFYVRYVIASMTRVSDVNDPNQFPNLRKRVVSDLAASDIGEDVRRYVRDLIYRYASKMVDSEAYSPTTRYNLLLLLGVLNEREAGRRGTPPAVPYGKATQVLLKYADSESEPDILRIGAMVGLAQHAKLQAAAGGDIDRQILSTFAKVLTTEPTEGASTDALQWMQRLATEVFADWGKPNAAKLLAPVIANERLPLYLRCSAARSLGRLDLKGTTIDVATAKGLGQVAVVSLTKQLEALREYAIQNPGGQTPTPRVGGAGDDPNAPEPPAEDDEFVRRFRRQLAHDLSCVQMGVKSLNSGNGDNNAKNLLTALQSELDKIFSALSNKGSRPDELFEAIQPPAARLESTVRQL